MKYLWTTNFVHGSFVVQVQEAFVGQLKCVNGQMWHVGVVCPPTPGLCDRVFDYVMVCHFVPLSKLCINLVFSDLMLIVWHQAEHPAG